ncbi:MAG: cysteine desulfurase [Salinivirgaceae bacterium]|nr:cysteine desulfurase [Salinivirgaceae bacterium]
MAFNIEKIRAQFPILTEQVYGKPLVYLDNAATTQKPQVVIDKIAEVYCHYNANVHRGVHHLSNVATTAMEDARKVVANFIGAPSVENIIFTRGATESLNLVAYTVGERFITENDEIIVSEMEHHSNLVPWQIVAQRKGAKVVKWAFNDAGELDLNQLEKLITPHTKIVAVTHVSNTLGTVNPVEQIAQIAHRNNVMVLIDGSQSIPHIKIDVQKMDCDFFVFSGHKIYGPTGIGALYGKTQLLEQLPPYQGGGEMIESVSFDKTTYNVLPYKFEAGTPNYVGIIVLAEALQFVQSIGIEQIATYEQELLNYATQRILSIDSVKPIGTAANKASVLSFVVNGAHPYDVGMILDKMGIAVRTGTHCTEPVMQHYGIPGTVRASFAFYNTKQEIDMLHDALVRAVKMFS